jgi:L-alanine-DL-glutamate epimerase-like enolase superfamily enzyme
MTAVPEHRIARIETVVPDDLMSGLLLLRIHTDTGIIGHGETYYCPQAVAAMVHDWMARRLLGADALAIEQHWRFLYERAANFGGRGCELRALSAIDLALWDILGQVCGQPVWQLLGGCSQETVQVYNSSGGPTYGRRARDGADHQGWPGYGDVGEPGPLQDNWASQNAAGDYAEELLSEGYTGMKMWPFDFAAHKPGGPLQISWADLETVMRPLREVRERVGMDIEIMLDGHGFFQLPAALRIAEALREIKPLWVEDLLRIDSVPALRDFREKAGVPLAVSEMFTTREDYRQVLDARAADYVMIDPTWIGGISETQRITQLAQVYNLPVTMHDCTGPLTLFAGLNVATANGNVVYQETVRAHIRTLYHHLIDRNIEITDGRARPPSQPGLGTRLLPDLFSGDSSGYRVSDANLV